MPNPLLEEISGIREFLGNQAITDQPTVPAGRSRGPLDDEIDSIAPYLADMPTPMTEDYSSSVLDWPDFDDASNWEIPGEFVKATARGAVDIVGSSLSGASQNIQDVGRYFGIKDPDVLSILKGTKQIGEKIKGVARSIPTAPGFEDSWTTAIGEPVGTTVGAALSYAAGGPLALAGFSGSAAYDQVHEQVKQAGGTDAEAANYAGLNAAVTAITEPFLGAVPGVFKKGAKEAADATVKQGFKIFKRINEATDGWFGRITKKTLKTSGGEALEETIQAVPEEIARRAYEKNPDLFDSLARIAYQGLIGGIVGGMFGGFGATVQAIANRENAAFEKEYKDFRKKYENDIAEVESDLAQGEVSLDDNLPPGVAEIPKTPPPPSEDGGELVASDPLNESELALLEDYDRHVAAGHADATPSREKYESLGFDDGGGTRKERQAHIKGLLERREFLAKQAEAKAVETKEAKDFDSFLDTIETDLGETNAVGQTQAAQESQAGRPPAQATPPVEAQAQEGQGSAVLAPREKQKGLILARLAELDQKVADGTILTHDERMERNGLRGIVDSPSFETAYDQKSAPTEGARVDPAPQPVDSVPGDAAPTAGGENLSPRQALVAYMRKRGYDSRTSPAVLQADVQYQELRLAADREFMANARSQAAETRAATVARGEPTTPEERIVRSPINELPQPVANALRDEARFQMGETKSPGVKAIMQKIIDGKDTGRAVEHHKQRLVDILTGKLDQRTVFEKQSGAPPRPVDPTIQAYLEGESFAPGEPDLAVEEGDISFEFGANEPQVQRPGLFGQETYDALTGQQGQLPLEPAPEAPAPDVPGQLQLELAKPKPATPKKPRPRGKAAAAREDFLDAKKALLAEFMGGLDMGPVDKAARLYDFVKAGVKHGYYSFPDMLTSLLAGVDAKVIRPLAAALKKAWNEVRASNSTESPYNKMAEATDEEIEKVLSAYGSVNDAGVGRQTPPRATGRGSAADVGRGERPGLRVVDEGNLLSPPEVVTPSTYPKGSLDEHQRYGVNLALARFLKKAAGFMLADGTGVGKTRQILAVAHQMMKRTGKPALIVTQNDSIIQNRFREDAETMGIDPDSIEMTIYGRVRGKPDPNNPGRYIPQAGLGDYSVVIFDESHNLKNYESGQTENARRIKADHVMYASATPLDKPTGGAYFLAQITGRPVAEVLKEIGVVVESKYDPASGEERTRVYPAPGHVWQDVQDNLIAVRNQAIEQGAMLRREYPFWGEVQMQREGLSKEQLADQKQIVDYWDERLAEARTPGQKRNAASQKVGELGRWLESQKIDLAKKMLDDAIASDDTIIITAEFVNDSTIHGLEDRVVPGMLQSLAKHLKDKGIDFAEIYGKDTPARKNKGKSKADEARRFQEGKVNIVLMTPKSGGAGIDLDDAGGNRPRTMIITTLNYAGDVFDQVLGRVSRRNTKTPANIRMIGYADGLNDQKRIDILSRKTQSVRRIQAGEDPDIAIGFADEVTEEPSRIAKRAAFERQRAEAKTKKFRKATGGLSMNRFLSPRAIASAAEYIEAQIRAGALTLAEVIERFAKKYGAARAAQMKEAFDAAWASRQGEGDGGGKGKSPKVGIKHAISDAQRADMGLPPVRGESVDVEGLEAYARQVLQNDPEAGARLVQEVLRKPRTLEARENAILVLHKAKLATKHDAALRAIQKERKGDGDAQKITLGTGKEREMATELKELNEILEASGFAGTAAGQALWSRKLLADPDDWTFSTKVLEEEADLGRPLTESELEYIEELIDEHEQQEKKVKKGLRKQAEQNAEDWVEGVTHIIDTTAAAEEEAAPPPPPAPAPKPKPKTQKVTRPPSDAAVKAARKKLDDAWKDLISEGGIGTVMANPFNLPKFLFKAVKVAHAYIDLGLKKREYQKAVAAKIGQEAYDEQKEGWDKAYDTAMAERAEKEEAPAPPPKPKKEKENVKPQRGRRDLTNLSVLTKFAKQLALYHIREGVRGRKAVAQAVQKDLEPFVPGITEEYVTIDLIGHYGQSTAATKDEARIHLAQLTGEAQQLGKIRSLLKFKKAPLASGQRRLPKGDHERRLERYVNYLKKTVKYETDDPDRQLRTIRQAIETRLRNEEADLREQIKNRRRTVPKEKPQPDPNSPEEIRLAKKRAEVKELRKQLMEMLPLPKTPAEVKLAKARKARLKKKIARLEADIANKERSAPPPKSGPITDAEIKELEKKAAELEERLEAISPKPGLTDDQLLERYGKYLTRKMAKIASEIALDHFEPTPRRKTPLNAFLRNEQYKLEKMTSDWHWHRWKNQFKKKNTLQKSAFVGRELLLNVQRAVIFGIDQSASLLQGGFFALGHPIKWADAVAKSMKAIGSARFAAEVYREIRSGKNADMYRTMKISFTDPDGTLTDQEEVFMSHVFGRIPYLRGFSRSYSTFLNLIRKHYADQMIYGLNRTNHSISDADAESIGRAINIATGRGNFGRYVGALGLLNTVFLAPRYVISRFQLAALQPVWTGTKASKKAWAKEYARALVGLNAVYGLTALGLYAFMGAPTDDDRKGWQIFHPFRTDPKNPNWGVIRIGEHKFDPLAGMRSAVNFSFRQGDAFVSGVAALAGYDYDLGESAKEAGREILRFGRYKLAPLPARAIDIAARKTVMGEPVTKTTLLRDATVPVSAKSIKDELVNNGFPESVAWSILGWFGGNPRDIDEYEQWKSAVRRSASRPKRPKRPAA